MPKQRISTNVILPPDLHAQLKQLADAAHMSMGALIRDMIRRHWNMDKSTVPVCANGTKCYVPHLHRPEVSTTPSTPPA